MPLFGRRAARGGEDAGGDGAGDASELERYASGRSWRPLGPQPFPELDAVVHDALRAWYGLLEYQPLGGAPGGIEYRDAFGGGFPRSYESPLSPREFRCAHAWTVMNTRIPASICLLKLGAPLPDAAIGLRPHYSVMHGAPEITFDDVDFTTSFEVRGPEPERVRALLVPEVRDRLMARDDWMTVFTGSSVLSVCFAAFEDGPDIDKRVEQLADLVAQFPRTRSGVPPQSGPRSRPWSDAGPEGASGAAPAAAFGGGPEGVPGSLAGPVPGGVEHEPGPEAQAGEAGTAPDEGSPLFTAEQRAHFAAEVRRRRRENPRGPRPR